MKRKAFSRVIIALLLALCLFVASACELDFSSFVPHGGSSSGGSSIDSSVDSGNTQKPSDKTDSNVPSDKIVDQDGGNADGDSSGDASGEVDFYAINDFHGEVEKISTVAGYLKEKASNNNTVLINSGDMFQGSLASNSNKGKLLLECMDEIGFDSFTYGNHEFDWGLSTVRSLSQQSKTPFLGANIYYYDSSTKQWGDFADDFADEYTVTTLDNGIKVGIIGVIGKDQITSITSTLVEGISFKDPEEVIPTISQKLRKEEDCDVVVVSLHASQNVFIETASSFDISDYADAVFCAHSHQNEYTTYNGIPFIQGGSYGNYVSHVKLSVKNGKVSCTTYENISYDSTWTEDAETSKIVSKYSEEIAAEAQKVVATTDAYLDEREELPRIVARSIAEYAVENGHDIVLAMVNKARGSIYKGNITFERLYEALPFDNIIYIVEVSGSDLINEAKYNFIWRIKGTKIESSKNYKIAVIDYLLYHKNTEGEYDYFPSAFKNGHMTPIALNDTYRDVTCNFLTKVGKIIADDYASSGKRVNTNLLTSTVSF